jgi:hypothetical protein
MSLRLLGRSSPLGETGRRLDRGRRRLPAILASRLPECATTPIDANAPVTMPPNQGMALRAASAIGGHAVAAVRTNSSPIPHAASAQHARMAVAGRPGDA